MAKFSFTAARTFATEINADKAVAKAGFSDLRHFMMKTEDGRFFPVFVGTECMQSGVHFHFHVVG